MKLNTDVRVLMKGKKTVYPTKRSMNLYFKADRTTAPATAALYILFALVVLLGVSKVMIYDLWSEAEALQTQALDLEELAEDRMVQLADYEEVLEAYTRAAPTQEELSQVDRMEILDLIDRTIRPEAAISQILISGHQVLVSFSGVTLKEAADLVALLEESSLVTATSVETAASTQGDQGRAEVHAYFEVAGEEAADS